MILGIGRKIVKNRNLKSKFLDGIWTMVVMGWVEEDLQDRRRDRTFDNLFLGNLVQTFIPRFISFEKDGMKTPNMPGTN